jgi:hypothetical protein
VRDIASEFFARSPAMAGPLVALVLFFVVFVAIAIRVLRARPDQFEGDAALPLSEGRAPAVSQNEERS